MGTLVSALATTGSKKQSAGRYRTTKCFVWVKAANKAKVVNKMKVANKAKTANKAKVVNKMKVANKSMRKLPKGCRCSMMSEEIVFDVL